MAKEQHFLMGHFTKKNAILNSYTIYVCLRVHHTGFTGHEGAINATLDERSPTPLARAQFTLAKTALAGNDSSRSMEMSLS